MSWLLSDSVASAYTVLGFAPSPPNVKFFIREVFYSVPFMEDEELSFFILFFIIQILLPLFLLIVIHYVLVEISFRSVFGI